MDHPNDRAGARFSRPCAVVMAAVLAAGLAGCQTPPSRYAAKDSSYQPLPIHASASGLVSSIPQGKLVTASRQLAAEGIKEFDAGHYEKASGLFNLALKVDVNNSYLHFLNALTYHKRGISGEGSLFQLAQQGYELAIQFDGSNAIARHYLGLLYLDRREFAAARYQLMEASLYARNDPDLLYDLAVAAYYAKDPRTAAAALEGLRALESGRETLRTLRASALVSAAMGDDDAARGYLQRMAGQGASAQEVGFTDARVSSWRETYGSGLMKAQVLQPRPAGAAPSPSPFLQPSTPPGFQPVPGALPGAPSGAVRTAVGATHSGFFDKNMVMLDVVIVATEEDNNDTYGVNLLEGLRIQFGNSAGTPGLSRLSTIASDLLNPFNDSSTRQVTRLIQLPAVTYTLNIANAEDRRNEVLARPSLVALAGQTSTFFSGTDVLGAAVSTGQGGSVQVQREAGVKLAVTPEFLPDNMIKMNVVAERTFLTNPNSNVLFDFRLDTSKTLVSANVAMKFGETLILSGLSERNTENGNSGVPLLRDVPLVQYLFSRGTKRDFQKSVLILVTPRRPTYTNRSEDDIATERARMSEFDRLQAEFEGRHKLWFKPVPNVVHAAQILETSPVFREFRSGDLKMETWVSRASHGDRLRSALGFLYN